MQPLLTRFDSRITLTGPTLYSKYTTEGISAQLILFCIWRNRHRCPAHTPVGTSNTPCRCLCTQAAPILRSYINKLYRHYNKHSTQTRSVHTAIAMPQQYQYFTSLNKTIEREGLSMPKPNQTEDNHPSTH